VIAGVCNVCMCCVACMQGTAPISYTRTSACKERRVHVCIGMCEYFKFGNIPVSERKHAYTALCTSQAIKGKHLQMSISVRACAKCALKVQKPHTSDRAHELACSTHRGVTSR